MNSVRCRHLFTKHSALILYISSNANVSLRPYILYMFYIKHIYFLCEIFNVLPVKSGKTDIIKEWMNYDS